MPKFMLLTAAALIAAAQPVTARAASTMCQSVNGHSVCTQSGDALSCQSVNGRTHCLSGSGTLRCDTIYGRTTCTTTRGTPLSGKPDEDADDESEAVLADPGIWDRDDKELRVRAGTLDLRLMPSPRGPSSRGPSPREKDGQR